MDETDLLICRELLMNSRQSYREIAEKLGISVNAVHKRVQALIDSQIIRRFRTYLNIHFLQAINVNILGKTSVKSINLLEKNLGRNDQTYWITLGAGGWTYIGGYLKSIAQLDEFMKFVINTGNISDPILGISKTFVLQKTLDDLHPIDFLILGELQYDARKNASEIAEKLGISAKTVNKHIQYMAENNMIYFSVEFFPDGKNDIMPFFHITIEDNADAGNIILQLYQTFPKSLLYAESYSNLPHFIFAPFWVDSFRRIDEIREQFASIPGIKTYEINMMFKGIILETWRDKLIQDRVAEYQKLKFESDMDWIKFSPN